MNPARPDELHRIAARIGADVPFFLRVGAQLATGDGTELTPVELPSDYWVVLVMPDGDAKESTGKVYAAFDERGGADRLRGASRQPATGARGDEDSSGAGKASRERPRVVVRSRASC